MMVVSAVGMSEVTNQSPPLVPLNLFDTDPGLQALVDGLPSAAIVGLRELGAAWGRAESFELGRMSDRNPPTLRTHDGQGRRVDLVESHPAQHALLRRGIASGLHASIWDAAGEEARSRTKARAARIYMAAMNDISHLATISSTGAAIAALGHAPQVAEAWVPGIMSRKYDQSHRSWRDKAGLTIGIATTEKQGGSDSEALAMEAHETAAGTWHLSGHKWFLGAPMADAHIVLAQGIEGVAAYLVPAFRQDGSRNAISFMRLKETIGHRGGPIAEAEFNEAEAWLIGERGRAETVMSDTMALMRLDDCVMASGMLRLAIAEAVHHARHRRVNGLLLIDQPLMARVLADIALDVIAGTALAFRIAESFDRASEEPSEAAYTRLMAPVGRYWTTKAAPAAIEECMECLGGNGYVEDSRLPKLYRDAPALAMRSGGGNAMCVQAMRVLRRNSEALEHVLYSLEAALGTSGHSSLNVLRAAAAVALADEGSSRVFVEQLAMTAAAAALRQRFPTVVSDAFLETRLSKPWRTTYGMLDSRFDAKAFLNYLLPA